MSFDSLIHSKKRLGFLGALLALTACESGAPITQIDFAKDSRVSGSIQIIPADEKAATGRTLTFEIKETDSSLSVPLQSVVAQSLQVRLQYINFENQPKKGPGQKPITLTITSSISLRAEQEQKRIVASVAQGSGSVSVDGKLLEGVNCDNLFSASASGQTVQVSFLGMKTLASCQGADFSRQDPTRIGKRDISKGSNFFSLNDDIRMGKEFTTEFMAKNPGKTYPENHPATLYFQALMDRIAMVSDMPQLKPRVHVINANVLNAFALPGGEVYIFRGLITASRSESELVGVMGHEWAHVTQRHGTRGMTRAIKTIVAAEAAGIVAGALIGTYGKDAVGDKYSEQAKKLLPELTSNGGALYLLNRGRAQEADADEIGSQYAWALHFTPWGLADLFEVLAGNTKKPDNWIEEQKNWLEEQKSDHPALQSRVGHVLSLSALFYPGPGPRAYQESTPRYLEVRNILSSDPWPPKEESINMGDKFAEELTAFAQDQVLKGLNSGKDHE